MVNIPPCWILKQKEMIKTTVMYQRKDSPSLRATIPEMYVHLLKLKSGDKLEWDHEIAGGEIIVKVRKARK